MSNNAKSTKEVAATSSSSDEASPALSSAQIIGRALKPNGKWDKDSFPEFMSVLYWMRQVISVVIGTVLGLWGVTGYMGFVVFLVANTLVPFVYYKHYANIDVDDFGHNEVLSEGYQPSFGMFLLMWIVAYSINH